MNTAAPTLALDLTVDEPTWESWLHTLDALPVPQAFGPLQPHPPTDPSVPPPAVTCAVTVLSDPDVLITAWCLGPPGAHVVGAALREGLACVVVRSLTGSTHPLRVHLGPSQGALARLTDHLPSLPAQDADPSAVLIEVLRRTDPTPHRLDPWMVRPDGWHHVPVPGDPLVSPTPVSRLGILGYLTQAVTDA